MRMYTRGDRGTAVSRTTPRFIGIRDGAAGADFRFRAYVADRWTGHRRNVACPRGEDHRYETLQVHAGGARAGNERPRRAHLPDDVVRSTTPSTAPGCSRCSSSATSTRGIMNPTTDVFEKRIAALEGGAPPRWRRRADRPRSSSRCRRSRRPATTSSRRGFLYGGTYNQFKGRAAASRHRREVRAGRFAGGVREGDRREDEGALRRVDRQSRVQRAGLPRARHARARSAASRSSWTTRSARPASSRGRSGTARTSWSRRRPRWIGGHGTAIGGVVVDAGTFDWGNGKFPLFTEPAPGYHGLDFGRCSARRDRSATSRSRSARAWKACATSARASRLQRVPAAAGLETLSLRVQRHAGTRSRSRWLKDQDAVEWVSYPGLEGIPRTRSAALPEARLRRRAHVRREGRARDAARARDRRAHARGPSRERRRREDVGSIRPRRRTSSFRTTSSARAAKPELIRVSVGIEHIDDIRDRDFAALAAAVEVPA